MITHLDHSKALLFLEEGVPGRQELQTQQVLSSEQTNKQTNKYKRKKVQTQSVPFWEVWGLM